jgi:hypothetical protein
LGAHHLDYIIHVDWLARNLSKELALVTTSQTMDYTPSNDTHTITINDLCKEAKETLSKRTPSYPIMPLKDETLQHLCETLIS